MLKTFKFDEQNFKKNFYCGKRYIRLFIKVSLINSY